MEKNMTASDQLLIAAVLLSTKSAANSLWPPGQDRGAGIPGGGYANTLLKTPGNMGRTFPSSYMANRVNWPSGFSQGLGGLMRGAKKLVSPPNPFQLSAAGIGRGTSGIGSGGSNEGMSAPSTPNP